MTYKLNPELEKIQSPIVLVLPDGEETEYINGTDLIKQTFESRYAVESIWTYALKVKSVIRMVE